RRSLGCCPDTKAVPSNHHLVSPEPVAEIAMFRVEAEALEIAEPCGAAGWWITRLFADLVERAFFTVLEAVEYALHLRRQAAFIGRGDEWPARFPIPQFRLKHCPPPGGRGSGRERHLQAQPASHHAASAAHATAHPSERRIGGR